MCFDNGDKEWFSWWKRHRDGGLPAIEDANGNKEWWINGKRNREGGLPAVEWADGAKFWYVNGELHRDGGLPAYEGPSGLKAWWVNGKRHRETLLGDSENDLPAVECANGMVEWWKNGKKGVPQWSRKNGANICLLCFQIDSVLNCSVGSTESEMRKQLKISTMASRKCPQCNCDWIVEKIVF
jgi:hypothetical protein